MAVIKFSFGTILPFSALPPNSIALDGVVQGPHLDPANRRYTFDHHGGCSRFATLATCQQVLLALQMGLAVDEKTVVLTNDIDADTVVAVWLLVISSSYFSRLYAPEVKRLVEQVGMMDAHYMGELHPMHRLLTPRNGVAAKEPQSLELLVEKVQLLEKWFLGTFKIKPADPVPDEGAEAIGWTPNGGWSETFNSVNGFNDVYDRGYSAGITWKPVADGTWLYTVAKRSDFVQLAIGPGHVDRNKDPSDYRTDTILGVLGMNELLVNPNQDPATSWGGGSNIGGSPRNKGPNGDMGSRLTPQDVIRIVRSFRD